MIDVLVHVQHPSGRETFAIAIPEDFRLARDLMASYPVAITRILDGKRFTFATRSIQAAPMTQHPRGQGTFVGAIGID